MAVCLCAGVVYANKPHAEVMGVARLLDEQHHLEAVISFGPVPGTRQRMLARADAVCGEIYQLPKSAHLQVHLSLQAFGCRAGATRQEAVVVVLHATRLTADIQHIW